MKKPSSLKTKTFVQTRANHIGRGLKTLPGEAADGKTKEYLSRDLELSLVWVGVTLNISTNGRKGLLQDSMAVVRKEAG
ncbi:hypothetical protein MPNT_190032 [Candidatus Methylacidithermus pantelleriae]|uniref:Uncharacterized protein n=1 Tax=Candidatus Methylacidithermus pantelleriae TaxID=2744239 RepID=A0A8J2BP04_9BACT|nr:hypothetical protein MPNT_190032 [Candidatus Methylacidithermus pantelleriae]